MEYIKNAIIKFLDIRTDENYIIIVPKKFENKKKYLEFMRTTKNFIQTKVNIKKK